MSFPFIKTAGGFSVIIDGVPYSVSESHQNYRQLLTAVGDSNKESFINNLNIEVKVNRALSKSEVLGKVEVKDGEVLFNGKAVDNVITKRILEFVDGGLPFKPLVAFLENIMANPSKRSIEELYGFLEHKALPITEDGCFLAYKTVLSNYYSKRAGNLTLISGKEDSSGRIFNGVGEVIECPRNEVDDDFNQHCSQGLHVGALAYAGPGGWYNNSSDKVVYVKVNPKDAVSVPGDHSCQKLRVCKYEVVSDYKAPLENHLYNTTNDEVEAFEDSDDYDWDDEDEWDDEEFTGIERIAVLPSDVAVDDYLEFTYNNELRTLVVKEVDSSHVKGVYLDNPTDTWDDLSETGEFRSFIKTRMVSVYKLV